MEWRRICCAADTSAASFWAARAAADLAKRLGARLLLLHVQEREEPDGRSSISAHPEVEQALIAEERLRIAELKREAAARVGEPVEATVVVGKPVAERIAAFCADQAVDLLVVGTHGHTGLRRALLGSVAQKLVAHAPCPVMVVGPPDRAAEAPERD
jgi:universal stress protein A